MVAQTPLHFPALHEGATTWFEEHTLEQPPQCRGSVAVRRQVPPHDVPPLVHWHEPAMQLVSPLQATTFPQVVPHVVAEPRSVSHPVAARPSHSSLPAGQLTHTPAEQVWVFAAQSG